MVSQKGKFSLCLVNLHSVEFWSEAIWNQPDAVFYEIGNWVANLKPRRWFSPLICFCQQINQPNYRTSNSLPFFSMLTRGSQEKAKQVYFTQDLFQWVKKIFEIFLFPSKWLWLFCHQNPDASYEYYGLRASIGSTGHKYPEARSKEDRNDQRGGFVFDLRGRCSFNIFSADFSCKRCPQ